MRNLVLPTANYISSQYGDYLIQDKCTATGVDIRMKQIKLSDTAYKMLLDISRRKDSLAVQASIEELIMSAYKQKK